METEAGVIQYDNVAETDVRWMQEFRTTSSCPKSEQTKEMGAQRENLSARVQKIEYEEVAGEDILWMPEVFSLDQVLKNIKGPTLVKVDEGAMNDENNVLECGEILTIHGEIKMLQIMATDEKGQSQHIPIQCVHQVEIMTLSDQIYKTIRDICNAVNMPDMVENTKQFTYYGLTFTTGSQFEIKSSYTENNIVAGLSMIYISHKKVRISLPPSVRGDFKEVLLPEDRGKQFMIKDLVKRKLPLCVGFIPTREKNPQYGPHLGRVTLKKIHEVDMVSAIAHEKDGDIFKPFSRQLDVMVVIGRKVSARNDYSSADMTCHSTTGDYVDMKSFNCSSVKSPTPFPTLMRGNGLEESSCPNAYKQDLSFPSVHAPQEDINDILHYLHLEKYAMSFKENLVDAKLLRALNEEYFTFEIHMTLFESTKLTMYLDGWRPITDIPSVRVPYELDEENPKHWRVNEVYRRMQTIQLSDFAEFCLDNQVDGTLLKKIANADTIHSIETQHGLVFSPIEQERLIEYVNEKDRDMFKPLSHQLDAMLASDASQDCSSVDGKGHEEASGYVDMKLNPTPLSNLKHKIGLDTSANDYKQDLSVPSAQLPQQNIKHILRYLQLQAYATSFEEKQVDVYLLSYLNEEAFTFQIKMTLFESKKLKMYLDGWRPIYELDEENPRYWPVKEVYKRMQTIQLSDFAEFCLDNQVDGTLLKKIANADTIHSIETQHGLVFSPTDLLKLREYLSGWRPTSNGTRIRN